jgi:predicted N-acetyltransferase YhbS
VALIIRPLPAQDLAGAGHILRLAFGTFLGAPEPAQFWEDMDYTNTRWRADPTAAFGAELDSELVGSNFATHWGSVGLFGPLSVRPDLWNQDIGQRLMEPVIECFHAWGGAACRAVHLCAQSETYRLVSEIRLLAALSHRRHVKAGSSRREP